jgi:hypothetical protein
VFFLATSFRCCQEVYMFSYMFVFQSGWPMGFGLLFSTICTSYSPVIICTSYTIKIGKYWLVGWHFGAIFSQTHLVTLFSILPRHFSIVEPNQKN